MERIIILKNTDTGEALTLPVTPTSYPMGAGRAVERLDMAQTGQVALPGLKTLFTGTLEFELPAIAYSYMTAGAVAEPQHYISLLAAWSRDANVCRYIVTGTEVNLPVLLGPLEYGESDGTNNVQCKLPLYEYRYLDEVQVEKVTQNSGRQVETPLQTAGSYTVVKGDSLWAICKKFYGDGSLAYKLATANNIKNPNLIYPGQVLTLPDKSVLAGYAATAAPAAKSAAKTATAEETKAAAKAEARKTIGLKPPSSPIRYAKRQV
ncbi:MAG: LysM peptidoglycan-binding domain-containing protein [Oscillospiraceae bacterium]|nr:LysM peptidoglycan-binding domain-containing protein [Oscillospiraceae bacterium]